jgi:hypothetical protein
MRNICDVLGLFGKRRYDCNRANGAVSLGPPIRSFSCCRISSFLR